MTKEGSTSKEKLMLCNNLNCIMKMEGILLRQPTNVHMCIWLFCAGFPRRNTSAKKFALITDVNEYIISISTVYRVLWRQNTKTVTLYPLSSAYRCSASLPAAAASAPARASRGRSGRWWTLRVCPCPCRSPSGGRPRGRPAPWSQRPSPPARPSPGGLYRIIYGWEESAIYV